MTEALKRASTYIAGLIGAALTAALTLGIDVPGICEGVLAN